MDHLQNLQSLREALQVSPDNIPLRQYLAETLLRLARPQEAEQEFRYGLALAADNSDLKLGLARSFFQQGKHSQSLVIVEELLRQQNASSKTYLLHSRLLLNAGLIQQALEQYQKAIEQDPGLADIDLSERLGINTAVKAKVANDKIRAYRELELNDSASNSLEKPTISFKDVGGMESVKEEIRTKIIYPLAHSELYEAYGKAIGGGILLYGPPGCGKTHLARATAGEIDSGFINVGINDILDMWLGNSERNLHAVFEQARYNKPCVLFFDEVDALAASRSDMRTSAGRQLINQFLAELDGVQANNDGILILAATNAPWHLDAAFRRPGRFDRILFVPPPDQAARASILRILCQGKPVDDLDYEYLAQKTSHFSGADLQAVVDKAVEVKLQDVIRTGLPKPLTTKDLVRSSKGVKSSTREWFANARNYALYSNQGGLYDDILNYLKML